GPVIIPEGVEQKLFGDKRVNIYSVSPKYFETLGIPLLAGRDFTELDLCDLRQIVIINETTARQAFPGQNPIGRRLRLVNWGQGNNDLFEIVGVVKDVGYHILPEETASIYQPIDDFGDNYPYYRPIEYNSTYIFVRTHQDLTSTLLAMEKLIRSIDPEAEFTQRTMDDALYLSMLP